MKCPTCGASTRAKTPDPKDTPVAAAMNIVQRTRVCENGHRFHTFEVDGAELARLRQLAYRARQDDAWPDERRAAPRREFTSGTRDAVIFDMKAGDSLDTISRRYGIDHGTARRWRRQAEQEAAA